MNNKEPFVQAALVCENVLQDKDNVISVIRMVDRFRVQIPPDAPPNVRPAIEFKLLLSLKSGAITGKSTVAFEGRSPSGKHSEFGESEIVLNGGEHGVNVIANVTAAVEELGVHWIDVRWNGKSLTQIPWAVERA